MSNPFGGSVATTGFTVLGDVTENAALRKTKGCDLQTRQPANKRVALGTITNQTRVQPFRAAKQANADGQPENEKGKSFIIPQTTLQNFSIHVDDETSQQETVKTSLSQVPDNKLQLHSGITSFTSLRTALVTAPDDSTIVIENSPECTDSPMLLDTSLDHHSRTEETQEERFQKIITVPEYSEEIDQYLKELEQKNRPKPGYMKKQPDITNSMRCILVDWLVEVAEEYKLHRETLCLSVNYIDRFLSQMSVLRGKLQLVGAASMFLAAKFEEIYPPDVGEFVYITDDTYSKKQVLRMEHLILKVLSFDVAMPTVNCFCEKFLKQCNLVGKMESLTMYLAELSLVDADPFLKYLPSVIAASAICLANHTFNKPAWTPELAKATGYQISDITDCVKDLYLAFCRAPTHPQQAVREKYKQNNYHQVSLLCPPPSMPDGVN